MTKVLFFLLCRESEYRAEIIDHVCRSVFQVSIDFLDHFLPLFHTAAPPFFFKGHLAADGSRQHIHCSLDRFRAQRPFNLFCQTSGDQILKSLILEQGIDIDTVVQGKFHVTEILVILEQAQIQIRKAAPP